MQVAQSSGYGVSWERAGGAGGAWDRPRSGSGSLTHVEAVESTGSRDRHTTARRTRRAFLPDAYGVELDKQGRILAPSQIRDEAGLVGKILIIGCGDYLELWHPDRWAEERARLAADGEIDEDDQ